MNPGLFGEMKQGKGDKHLKANGSLSIEATGSSYRSLNVLKRNDMIMNDNVFNKIKGLECSLSDSNVHIKKNIKLCTS